MISCVIDNIIFSLQRSGGISILWKNLIKRMYRDKRLYVRFLEYDNATNNVIRETFAINPKNYVKLLSSTGLMLKRYINFCNSQITSPYIFHSTYYRTDRNPKSFNVTTVHDFIYEKYVREPRKIVHKTQKWSAIRKSDAIICVSENTKKDLLYYLPEIDESKITVVHNGVDPAFKKLNGGKNYFPIPFAPQQYVLYVGARNPHYKNFELVVEACAQAGLPLVLTGGGGLTKHERALLDSRLGHSSYLKTGIVETRSLNELYNNALALVYPSKYEGFGLPIIEAQKAGCPVIAFNDSCIPEVMGDGGICLDNKSPEGVVEALNFIYDNPEETLAMVERGYANANNYSWDKNYFETISVYAKLWEERTGRDSRIPY